jgi:nicotinate-nucleotide pyrophosphorylase (carboxylating)
MTYLDNLKTLIKTALAEDVGSGDITSQLLIPEDASAELLLVARQKMVLSGVRVPALVYSSLAAGLVGVKSQADDGDVLRAGDVIATLSGNARAILTGERVTLNIMQRMSGVATLTRQYVDAIAGTHAKILDTRKTLPGMRLLDKYAVQCGGGVNHRMGLYDAVLVKDNHVALMGGIAQAIAHCRSQTTLPIIVECDTLEQLREVLAAKPDRIMLDNMSNDMLREAVRIVAGTVPLEATGGVNLQTIRGIAETGVDYISVGAITHSAPAVDIGLDAR